MTTNTTTSPEMDDVDPSVNDSGNQGQRPVEDLFKLLSSREDLALKPSQIRNYFGAYKLHCEIEKTTEPPDLPSTCYVAVLARSINYDLKLELLKLCKTNHWSVARLKKEITDRRNANQPTNPPGGASDTAPISEVPIDCKKALSQLKPLSEKFNSSLLTVVSAKECKSISSDVRSNLRAIAILLILNELIEREKVLELINLQQAPTADK